MGCFGSKPDPAPSRQARNQRRSQTSATSQTKAKKEPETPTFGLEGHFKVVKMLGVGGEGETWLCTDLQTNEDVAIKFIKRPIVRALITVIQREIKIVADLGDGHLNIVGADELLLSKTHLGLVMEYIAGGNMVQYVTSKRESRHKRGGLCIDEDEACYLFRQLASAVWFCHTHHVAHRDLKLDNTLLDKADPPRLKLCDFGFARSWSGPDSNMDTMRIGTPEYMGPELITSRCGYDGVKVDVWACGVLLFVMLLGQFPFEGEGEDSSTVGLYDIFVAQMGTRWRDHPHNAQLVQRLSSECIDLLSKMFDTNQETRISMEGVMKHAWCNRQLPEKYAAGLDRLAVDQAAIDARATSGEFKSKERDQALQTVLEMATKPPAPNEQVVRVSLSQPKRAYSFVADKLNGMGTVNEEEEVRADMI